MKAPLVALLICLGCTAALAEPCQAATPHVARATPAADSLAPCTTLAAAAAGGTLAAAPLQKVAVRTPPAEAVAFIAPAAGSRSGSAASFGTAKAPPAPQEPPAPGSRGRSMLLVGVALMAGIALRRYGAGRG